MPHEIYETSDELIVVFLGEGGSKGLLRRGEAGTWDFFNPGSTQWDLFHQSVYRNFNATKLTAETLTERGIALPELDEYAKKATWVEWAQNFDATLPLAQIPAEKLAKFRARKSPHIVYLILSEDLYESSFGDGVAFDPHAAFWDETAARDCLEQKKAAEASRPKNELGYRYVLKSISVTVDEQNQKLNASLNIQKYEHYTLARVLELLSAQ